MSVLLDQVDRGSVRHCDREARPVSDECEVTLAIGPAFELVRPVGRDPRAERAEAEPILVGNLASRSDGPDLGSPSPCQLFSWVAHILESHQTAHAPTC